MYRGNKNPEDLSVSGPGLSVGCYFPNSAAAFFIRSVTFTPKGQRFSQPPQATHSPA